MTTIPLPHCTINLTQHRVVRMDGTEQDLAEKEAAVLRYLLQRAGTVVSRQDLQEAVWGYHRDTDSFAVAVAIRRLRAKVERDAAAPELIKTVRGVGWMLTLPAAPSPQITTNLLADPDPLIGRVSEQAALTALLSRHRLVNILGPGGMGKTRLARETARQLAGSVEEVWFVDLSTCRSAGEVLSALSAELSLELPAQLETATRTLGRALAGRGRLLLVLDNLEQVVAPVAPLLSSWLAAAPETHILTTSRERLLIAAEHVFPLSPLSPEDARELFEARAAATGRSITAPRAVLALLEGVPLSIVLATSRLNLLSIDELHSRLSDQLRTLRSRRRDLPARHLSLRATMDWSWQMLSEDEQCALARCSIFASPFTLDAAEAVAGADEERLSSFEERSWLRRTEEGLSTYGFIRDYLREKLSAEPAILQRTTLAHIRWFARLLPADLNRQMVSRSGAAARRLLQASRSDLQQALDAAISIQDSASAARLASPLVAQARAAGLPGAIVAQVRDVLAMKDLPDERRLQLLLEQGALFNQLNLYVAATESCTEALRIAEETDNRGQVYAARGLLAYSLRWTEGVRPALAHAHAAVEGFAALGDPFMEASFSTNLAELLQDDPQACRALLDRALLLAQQSGNHRAEGNILQRLANLDMSNGDLDVARTGFETTLMIYGELGLMTWLSSPLNNLGLLNLLQGHLSTAERYLSQALGSARRGGRWWAEVVSLLLLSELSCHRGAADRARQQLRRATELTEEADNDTFRIRCLRCAGELAMQQGEHPEARRLLDASLQLSLKCQHPHGELDAHLLLGSLDLDQGALDAAEAALTRAEALSRQLNEKLGLHLVTCHQARLAHARGQPADAERLSDVAAFLQQLRATDQAPLAVLLASLIRG